MQKPVYILNCKLYFDHSTPPSKQFTLRPNKNWTDNKEHFTCNQYEKIGPINWAWDFHLATATKYRNIANTIGIERD